MSLHEDNLSFSDQDEEKEENDEVMASIKKVEVSLLKMVNQLDNEDSIKIITDNDEKEEIEKTILPIDDANAYPCPYRHTPLPPTPDLWPQRPLLLRPTPNSNTHIRGIRYASTLGTFEPLPGGEGEKKSGYCLGCTLPINNGSEPKGKSLVIDFETNKFIGTAMLRIKDAKPLALKDDNNVDIKKEESGDYFEGKKRTFQAVIRGKFICDDIPMSECVTGQIFDKPAGHLPPRLILTSAVKVISHLAPQLQAEFHGDAPRFLSPLVSTAQSVVASSSSSPNNNKGMTNTQWTEKDDNYKNKEKKKSNYEFYAGSDESIEYGISEPPPSSPTSLLQTLPDASSFETSSASSQTARAKIRKKAFDKLYSQHTKTPTFDTSTEYTFEFYQHLLDFTSGDTLSLDLGKALGKHGLDKMLNEQPLKFMAAHQKITTIDEEEGDTNRKGMLKMKKKGGKKKGGKKKKKETMDWLWSFDIWHESLYPPSAKGN